MESYCVSFVAVPLITLLYPLALLGPELQVWASDFLTLSILIP